MVKLIGAANETALTHDDLVAMSAHIAHLCPNGGMQLERIWTTLKKKPYRFQIGKIDKLSFHTKNFRMPIDKVPR